MFVGYELEESVGLDILEPLGYESTQELLQLD
jgi:hypothetical protein